MDRLLAVFRDIGGMLAALVTPVLRSFRQNSGLAVLSIVLAFGVWIVVSDAENPETTRVVETDIPVEPINIPREIAVAQLEPETVRVRVRVEEDVLDTLTAADFAATLDLEGFTVGDFTQPVDVRPLTSRGGLRVDEVLPPDIDVSLVPLITKRVPVVIEVRGDPSPGFVSLDLPQPDVENVNVSGPQSQIDQVTQATATLSIEGATDTIEQIVRLEPRNRLSVLVPKVTLDPALIEVSVVITQQTFSRPVVVSPDLSGSPAEGFAVTGVSVEPATVTVTGPKSLIEAMVDIRTDPISISNADSDVVSVVNLDPPTDVETVGGGTVTVSVTIRPLFLTFKIPVTIDNLGSDLTVVGTPPTVDVTLDGPSADRLDPEPGDLVASIDVKDLAAGSYELNVEISAPVGLEILDVSPDSVTITLVQS
ncbi:MAG: YbbR-like domain-containing protein [Dehalococcoidia bacterium]